MTRRAVVWERHPKGMEARVIIRLSKCMLFQVTPGTNDPVLDARDCRGASVGEIIRLRMKLTFPKGHGSSQFLFADSCPALSSEFFDTTLSDAMPTYETFIQQRVGIQQLFGDALDDLECFHGVCYGKDVLLA